MHQYRYRRVVAIVALLAVADDGHVSNQITIAPSKNSKK
jgi:hypothetical protein